MNLVYFKDMDSLYLELLPQNPDHAWEAQPGVTINLAEDGRVVGIIVEEESKRANMDLLKIGNFPGQVETIAGGVKPH